MTEESIIYHWWGDGRMSQESKSFFTQAHKGFFHIYQHFIYQPFYGFKILMLCHYLSSSLAGKVWKYANYLFKNCKCLIRRPRGPVCPPDMVSISPCGIDPRKYQFFCCHKKKKGKAKRF